MAELGKSGGKGVTCPACGFENAPATLYCQDCGAKLEAPPPSYLAAPPVTTTGALTDDPAARAAAPVARKPRILSRRRVGGGGFGAVLGSTVRILIYAAFVAFGILLFRTPRDLPPEVPAIDGPTVDAVRESLLTTAQRGSTVDAPWDRVNAYLGGTLAGSGSGGPIRFVRAFVTPEPDGFGLGLERRLGPVPVVTTVDYRIVARSNGIGLEPTGAAIGRIHLPAFAARIVEMLNGNLATALQFEADTLRNARRVRVSPTSAQIDFSPNAR